MSRPEKVAPPEIFYNEKEAQSYAINTRMVQIQTQMAKRAIELLQLPKRPCYLLDIGCGTGLSGNAISELGHYWVGMDIAPAMLGVALQREVSGDMIQSDMGHGVMFRPGSFDGAISISAVQWLCNADKKSHVPQRRLKRFFTSLYTSLARGARAVLQLYPDTPQQMTLITTAAMRAGFSGGLVIDNPESTKAKKYYLCLSAGASSSGIALPLNPDQADQTMDSDKTVLFSAAEKDRSTQSYRGRKGKKSIKDRDWVLKKKERRRKQGRSVAKDSKYTARRRKHRF